MCSPKVDFFSIIYLCLDTDQRERVSGGRRWTRRRENVVLGHMKPGARIPRRGPRESQTDGGSCSKLSLLYTLSRAAQLTQSQVCSLFYDGKEPTRYLSQISLASGYALGRNDAHTDGLSTSMVTDPPRHTPGTCC